MFRGGTIAQFKAVLEEMKNVYNYDDDKTKLSTVDFVSRSAGTVQICTTDEATGVHIMMEKTVEVESY